MTLKSKFINNFVLFSLFFFCSLVSYFGLWNVFFQQDEWFAFGEVIYSNHVGLSSLIGVSGFHFVPLATYFVYVFFNIYKLHYPYYAALALLLHALNGFLVYVLALKFFEKKLLAGITSVLFLFANAGQQAVTWYATTFSVLPETVFVLLSVINFVDYIHSKREIKLLVSLIMLAIAFLFKEDALFMPLIYMFVIFAVKKKNFFQNAVKIGTVWLIYFIMRFIVQIGLRTGSKAIKLNPSYFTNFLLHLFVFPAKGFMQALLSQKVFLDIAHFIVNINQAFFLMISPTNSIDLFVEEYMVNVVIVVFFAIILYIFFYFLLFSSQKNRRLSLFFGVFSCSLLLPLIFLPPGLDIESRHLYLPSVGALMLFVLLWAFYFQRTKEVEIKIVLSTGLFLFFLYNFFSNNQQIIILQQQSQPRIAFVNQVNNKHILLPSKIIFFAEGDPLPLQSGPGQTLEVLLSEKNDLTPFLKENFLWDQNNGYKEIGNKGFGFFYDKELFLKTYQQYHLKPENIMSFSWDSKTSKLTDTTEQTRKELYDQ